MHRTLGLLALSEPGHSQTTNHRELHMLLVHQDVKPPLSNDISASLSKTCKAPRIKCNPTCYHDSPWSNRSDSSTSTAALTVFPDPAPLSNTSEALPVNELTFATQDGEMQKLHHPLVTLTLSD